MKKTFNYLVFGLYGLVAEFFLIMLVNPSGLFSFQTIANFILAADFFIVYRVLIDTKIFQTNLDKKLKKLLISENAGEKISFGFILGFFLTIANYNLWTLNGIRNVYFIWFTSIVLVFNLWIVLNWLRVKHVTLVAPNSLDSRKRLYE